MSTESLLQKAQMNYETVRDWLYLKQCGHSLADYFRTKKYEIIVLYGGGDLGQLLIEELDGSNIEIKCVYDNNAKNIYAEKPVAQYVGQRIDADCVVITAVFEADDITMMLREAGVQLEIISLKDVVGFFG